MRKMPVRRDFRNLPNGKNFKHEFLAIGGELWQTICTVVIRLVEASFITYQIWLKTSWNVLFNNRSTDLLFSFKEKNGQLISVI